MTRANPPLTVLLRLLYLPVITLPVSAVFINTCHQIPALALRPVPQTPKKNRRKPRQVQRVLIPLKNKKIGSKHPTGSMCVAEKVQQYHSVRNFGSINAAVFREGPTTTYCGRGCSCGKAHGSPPWLFSPFALLALRKYLWRVRNTGLFI